MAGDGSDARGAAFRVGAPMLATPLSRRRALRGFAEFLAGIASLPLAACRRSAGVAPSASATAAGAQASSLNFSSVAATSRNAVTVADGYRARLLCATGDPLFSGLAAYSNDGRTPPAEFERRVGDNHDGMHFFAMDRAGAYAPDASERGVLWRQSRVRQPARAACRLRRHMGARRAWRQAPGGPRRGASGAARLRRLLHGVASRDRRHVRAVARVAAQPSHHAIDLN